MAIGRDAAAERWTTTSGPGNATFTTTSNEVPLPWRRTGPVTATSQSTIRELNR